ncbi:glycosyltransferase [Dechloromonas sp. CZR5]|uniref:glycosyltransferase n=1 Tax=Dechloromonas sp. CZR5 TaxID=2608630 RepID=UPI00123C8CEF|nr:glycosyltransferase [Dechloromonas sp. CZR5]
MTRVLHIITGLGLGGAEMMLLKLLQASDRVATEHVVLTLTDLDILAPDIRALGVQVQSLGVAGGPSSVCALWRARCMVGRFRPDAVMTWLHHADLFGVALKCLAPSIRLIWNLRCSRLSPEELPRSNILLVKLLARLSFIPAVIVANARFGMEEHIRMGYSAQCWKVLPNGFDVAAFAPDAEARSAMRQQFGVSDGDFVIGMVGRYHAMKGFDTFVRAAGLLAKKEKRARFVLVGTDVTEDNTELKGMLEAEGILGKVALLGPRRDVPAIMNAFDILASTSTSEGFPNVIGEAMSCGIPCAVTDVGDSSCIVGQAGVVVQAGDDEAMAAAWQSLLAMPEKDFLALKQLARQRIVEEYEIGVVASRYLVVFEEKC